jgi:dihydropteroate synthase
MAQAPRRRAVPAARRGLTFARLGAGQSLYLLPLAMLSGSRAKGAVGERVAQWLAGGPLAFAAVELVMRDAERRIGRRFTLPQLRYWMARQAHAMGRRVIELLARTTESRPPFAGLAANGPLVMGVINVTPDSFSDGGRFLEPDKAIAHGVRMMEQGADLIDVGGESTRPGADPVSPEEERRRVVPVVRALAERGIPVSIDSRHAPVLGAALEAGARIINDITALADPANLKLAARTQVPVILMHMLGEPRTMQASPSYREVALDLYDFFQARIAACGEAGIGRERLCLDPGIGFGKSVEHNRDILANVAVFHGLGCPLLLGVSRKSFIARLSRGEASGERLPGSLAAALAGLDQGVQVLRVHDVAETVQARAVWRAIAVEAQ